MIYYKHHLAGLSLLFSSTLAGGTAMIAEVATAPDGFSSWLKGGVLIGILTGAIYAVSRKAVSYGVDRIIKSWEMLEGNQTLLQKTLDRLAADFQTHLAVEQVWQQGIEIRVRMLEQRDGK